MKNSIVWLMLLLGITVDLFAQEKSDNVFRVPQGYIFHRKFYIELDKGNRFYIEMGDINDLSRLINIDSIMNYFVKDLSLLKDSLNDEVTAKRIDYLIDPNGMHKIRFRQYQPRASSFLVQNGELASLRVEQDSIYIIGTVPDPAPAHEKLSSSFPRYYKLSFLLNSIEELNTYLDGRLPIKMKYLSDNYSRSKWYGGTTGWGNYKLKGDPNIKADLRGGHAGSPKDFLSFNAHVAVQNYKNYFVPSFGVGAFFTFSNVERTFRREFGLSWEPMFSFVKDSVKNVQTSVNHFLTLSVSQGMVKDYDPRKEFSFLFTASLSYLIQRNGDMFDENSFRLSMGKIKLYKTTLEPTMYFSNFFNKVTPSLRIVQSF